MSPHVRTTGELREALTQKLNELKESLGADVVTLHLYDPQRDRLYFPVSAGLLYQQERFTRSMPAMERVAGRIVRSRKPIIADDAEHHPDMTGPFTHAERVKTAAGFPLLVPDSREVMGVLFVNYRRAHQLEKDEAERIESWASELVEFISRSLRGDQGRTLRDALRMEADLRLEELRLFEILGQLWEVLGDADVALWTRKRGERKLQVRAHAGLDPDFVARVSVDLDADRYNLVSVAFVDRKEVLIESPKDAPEATFNVAASVAWQHMLAGPVSSEYHRLGVLCAFRRERPGFTRRERDLVRAFANLIAVTIENEDRIVALNALHDVGVHLTLVTELSDIVQEIVRSACQIIGADVATIHLYEPARQEFHDLDRSAVFPPKARSDMEKPRGTGGLSARIIEEGRIYCEDIDTQASPITLSTFVREQEIKAYVGTPLTIVGEPLGVLYVSFKEERRFSPDDFALIQILANYASTAVYRAALLAQRAAVTEIARDITSELDRDALLQRILERSLKLLDCEIGSIALWNKAAGQLEYRCAIGKDLRLGWPAEKGLMTAIAQTRQPVRVGDVTKDPRYVKHVEETRSELDVPLLLGDELIGVLNAESLRYNAFSEEDERLAMTLANQAAVALYNAALFEQRSALVDFGQAVTSGIRLREDEVLELIYSQASKLMDTRNMYIALYDQHTDTVSFGLALEDAERVVVGQGAWIPRAAGKGATEAIIRTRKPLLFRTAKEAKEWYTRPENKEYTGIIPKRYGYLGVPMIVGEGVLGVIAVRNHEADNVYSSHDLEILQAMASQAAVAIDNARLLARETKWAQQLAGLQEIGVKITSHLDLEEVLGSIVENSNMVTSADFSTLFPYNSEQDRFESGIRRGKVEVKPSIPSNRGFSGHIAKTQQAVFVEDAEKQPSVKPTFIKAKRVKSFAGVPLIIGRRTVGVLYVNFFESHSFSVEEREAIRLLANQAAVAIENARLYGEMEQRVKERTRQLEEAQEKALAAEVNAAVGLVTAEVAHHSKSLAGIIRSCANRLKKQLEDLTPEQEEDLSKIVTNSEAIAKAAEDLFKPFRREPKAEVSIDLMLREALDVLGKQPDIDIQVSLAPDLPKVNVQVQKVTTYITELLNNALKFTRRRMKAEGIEREEIEVYGQLSGDGYIELTFTNHGPPIPREDWEEIFKLFSAREEAAEEAAEEARSYGLGLWGARKTMRAHDGDVCILESNEKRTVFLLCLPAQQQEG